MGKNLIGVPGIDGIALFQVDSGLVVVPQMARYLLDGVRLVVQVV